MADEQQQVIEQQEEVVEQQQEEVVEATDQKQGKVEPAPPEWGEDISPDKDGGLFKKVLVEGKGEEQPLQGDKAFVHYTGRLLNGQVFDSSVDRNEPFSFQIGKGAYGEDQVIKGWDIGIQTMRKGEKSTLTCRPEYAYGEKGSPPAIPENATLQFDIELLSWQGEDVTSDGGVLKSIVKEGVGYTRPSEGAQCNVHIRGSYNGRVFDERDVTFEYGEGSEQELLPGVEKAIGQMKDKECSRVMVKPEYGFGEDGNPDLGIPGDAELLFEIRLNSFQKTKNSWEYDSVEERKTEAEKLKDRGSKYFKEGKYSLAQKLYERGVEIVSDSSITTEEDKASVRVVKVALHLNLAACHLKMDDPSVVISECEKVLEEDSKNVKAYFRRGQARQLLQDYQEAIADFQEVQKIEPTNKAAKTQITASRNKMKQRRDQERRRFANMFDRFAAEDERNQPEAAKQESASEHSPQKVGEAEERIEEERGKEERGEGEEEREKEEETGKEEKVNEDGKGEES